MVIHVSQPPTTPYEKWRTFIHSGDEENSKVREEIYSSWQRCVGLKVDPENNNLHDHLSGNKLLSLLQLRQKLIEAAHPFMAELYNVVKGTGFVVALTNEDGYIIELFGDEGAEKLPMTANFFIGASWHEKDAGTNAIGAALEEKERYRSRDQSISAGNITASPAPLHQFLIRPITSSASSTFQVPMRALMPTPSVWWWQQPRRSSPSFV